MFNTIPDMVYSNSTGGQRNFIINLQNYPINPSQEDSVCSFYISNFPEMYFDYYSDYQIYKSNHQIHVRLGEILGNPERFISTDSVLIPMELNEAKSLHSAIQFVFNILDNTFKMMHPQTYMHLTPEQKALMQMEQSLFISGQYICSGACHFIANTLLRLNLPALKLNVLHNGSDHSVVAILVGGTIYIIDYFNYRMTKEVDLIPWHKVESSGYTIKMNYGVQEELFVYTLVGLKKKINLLRTANVL